MQISEAKVFEAKERNNKIPKVGWASGIWEKANR